ncbi:FAD-dependent oxidoreductase [uncultured Arthrobacter sp.]|uniref:FAD-dependent oxidoreductase n=1 Tax=uncultured Arthrobacter sp. TaxID=114050 RepID=UPI002615C276|nr:FAD-dependent oxidoreductase [uncultured Arthrobacter sp.]
MLQVVVIGAGQAGLSAAYHLQRQGLRPDRDFAVLDANEGPGGAWRHRWDSLTFGTAHNIHDLPAMELGTPDPSEPASSVVTRYYRSYEQEFGLKVRRPVRVEKVEGNEGALTVHTDSGTLRTRLLINATGTWDRPYWPHYPGRSLFRGRQLHTHDFVSAEEFRDKSVVVVGAGTSAVQFLLQLADVGATTTWVTRRPPLFTDRTFDSEWGRDVERKVHERTKAGLPPSSVVSVTGLPLTDQYQAGIDAGILRSKGPLKRITETGIELDDGTTVLVDAILWATGFRAALDHLKPLKLREPGGGIRMDGVRVLKDERVLLVGYGASASTLGATRAGRAAAVQAVRQLNSLNQPETLAG